MNRYLLDTNIVSELVKPRPSEALLVWFADQPDDALFISTFTIAEIAKGVLLLPIGRKRRDLETWFQGPTGPAELFAGRVLDFDTAAAMAWARLMAEGQRQGRSRSPLDMIVAAIAQAHDCRIVTANERHFVGLDVVNPMVE